MRSQKRKAKPNKMDKLRYELEDAQNMVSSLRTDLTNIVCVLDILGGAITLSPEMALAIANMKSKYNLKLGE